VRASWGRLLRPSSWREVRGCEGGGWPVDGWPFVSAVCEADCWECDCDCVFGCVEEAVPGLGFCPPDAVAGGVDIPLASSPPAGDAMLFAVGTLESFSLRTVGSMLEEWDQEAWHLCGSANPGLAQCGESLWPLQRRV
jgi:hypothetical protein